LEHVEGNEFVCDTCGTVKDILTGEIRDPEAEEIQKGWIGVDLDGTLAIYDGWKGIEHIGEPILPMVDRVKQWIADGRDVRIMTARVSEQSLKANSVYLDAIVAPIQRWCLKHIGYKLPVTCKKDLEMIELWDDRCVQVIPNTGQRADGKQT